MSWREASIVHLAPICGELQPDIFDCLRGGMVVATIQGWLRSFERDGLASPSAARLSALPLEQLSAVVLSDEDLDGSGKPSRRTAKVLDELRSRVPVVGLTHGDRGSTLYYGNRSVEIPAVPANAIDVVGAGDIYATALFVRLAETGDPVKSAYFASCAASLSVEGEGWSRIPDRAAIDRRIRKFPWGE